MRGMDRRTLFLEIQPPGFAQSRIKWELYWKEEERKCDIAVSLTDIFLSAESQAEATSNHRPNLQKGNQYSDQHRTDKNADDPE